MRALLRRGRSTARSDGVAPFRRHRGRPGHPRGSPGRAADRADAHGVPAARALPAQPAAGAHPLARSSSASGATTSARSSNSLDVYIGYLRRKLEAGGEPRARPDGSRGRLRPARAVSSAPPHARRRGRGRRGDRCRLGARVRFVVRERAAQPGRHALRERAEVAAACGDPVASRAVSPRSCARAAALVRRRADRTGATRSS